MGFLDILFPVSCLECKKGSKYICDDCLTKVEVICRINPKNNTYSIFKYEAVVRKAIIALKYKFASDVVRELSQICTQKLKNDLYFSSTNTILIPIPLHSRRQNWRGFNQSEVVGKQIAKDLGWEFEPNILVRELASKPQVGLTKSERVRNISGKFAVNSSLKEKIRGQKIIVFDDVVTTGATMEEAIKVLEKSGAKEVFGLTIAK